MGNTNIKELVMPVKNYKFNIDNIDNGLEKLEKFSKVDSSNIIEVKIISNIVKSEKNNLERQTQGNSINAKTWTVVGLIITVFLAFYSEVLSSLFKDGVNETVYTILLILTMLLIIVLGFLGVKDAFRSAKKYELLKNVELLQYNLEVLIEEANDKIKK